LDGELSTIEPESWQVGSDEGYGSLGEPNLIRKVMFDPMPRPRPWSKTVPGLRSGSPDARGAGDGEALEDSGDRGVGVEEKPWPESPANL
jgi:hypothetical protein